MPKSKKQQTCKDDTKGKDKEFRPVVTIEKILSLKAENPKLTQDQLAKLLSCHRTNIIHHLKQNGMTWSELSQGLETFKKNKADVLSLFQRRILAHLTEAKLEKATAKELATIFGIFHDKERAERGKSTNSQGIWAIIVKEASKKELDITPKKAQQLITNQLAEEDIDE